MFDVVVIGGGVIGGTILRELSKYSVNALMLEKESDVCMGASKANSGIVHAGFDAKSGSLKAKFNVLGSKMMKDYAKELGVKYKNNGSIVLAFSEEEKGSIKELYERGISNGVKDLEIVDKEQLKKLIPNVSENAICALYAKTGGIICPYELTIASIGNAMDNGAKLKTDFEVVKIDVEKDGFTVYSSKGESVKAKVIINASGAGSEKVAKLVGDDSVSIGYRRGEYVLLDREAQVTPFTIFAAPTAKGKGVLVSATVDNNTIIGPTAEVIEEFSTATTQDGLGEVIAKSSKMVNNIPYGTTITSFAGVRAFSKDRHDFIIEESKVKNFINVCGIESPGLSSAPAIAEYVVNTLVPKGMLVPNPNFNGKRKPETYFKNLSDEEKNEIIKKDHRYGNIICRCEQVTEGEIVSAIKENPKATDIDGVKRRTRSGMGRCQGGFCQPRVAEILARELNIPITEVTKFGGNSKIIEGTSK